MNKPWHGLIKILEIEHLSANGKVLWSAKNLRNMVHNDGTNYMLSVCYAGGTLADPYYFGLDNRSALNDDDTMASIIGEPSGGGYTRAVVGGSNFTIDFQNSIYVATAPIVSFTATAVIGPVQNLFLTTQPDNTGFLIASVPLGDPLTFSIGQTVNMRLGLSLKDCPDC